MKQRREERRKNQSISKISPRRPKALNVVPETIKVTEDVDVTYEQRIQTTQTQDESSVQESIGIPLKSKIRHIAQKVAGTTDDRQQQRSQVMTIPILTPKSSKQNFEDSRDELEKSSAILRQSTLSPELIKTQENFPSTAVPAVGESTDISRIYKTTHSSQHSKTIERTLETKRLSRLNIDSTTCYEIPFPSISTRGVFQSLQNYFMPPADRVNQNHRMKLLSTVN